MQLHMRKRWTYTDRGTKLISITGEEQTVYYPYWGNDQHTKGNTVNYLHRGNDQHTKGSTDNYLHGVTTNIEKGKTVNYLNGVTTNIQKDIPSITSTG